MSALRAALAPAAGPQLAMEGGLLATSFLESGLASGGSCVAWSKTCTLQRFPRGVQLVVIEPFSTIMQEVRGGGVSRGGGVVVVVVLSWWWW